MEAPTESEMNTKSLLVAKSRFTNRTVMDSDGRSYALRNQAVVFVIDCVPLYRRRRTAQAGVLP